MRLLEELLRDNVGKVYTAVSAEVRQQGCVLFRAAYGSIEPAGNKKVQNQTIQTDTLFDLASLTKLFTTTAFFRLIETGKTSLDESVAAVLTEFRGPRLIRPYPNPLAVNEWISVVPHTDETIDAGAVTFEHLLTHSSGLPAWLNLRERQSLDDRIAYCLSTPFAYPTGSRALYSDIGYILLGMAIERLTGLSLGQALEALVLKPLGLSVRYGKVKDHVAPTGFCQWRQRRLVGEVHDENAAALGGIAGHAGLFGTASDVATLGQIYLNGGRGFINPGLVEEATRTHVGDRGLGWIKPTGAGSSSGDHFSPESYGHTGFTGGSLWVDPGRGLVCALLTNRVFFGRDAGAITALRREFHNTVIEALKSRR